MEAVTPYLRVKSHEQDEVLHQCSVELPLLDEVKHLHMTLPENTQQFDGYMPFALANYVEVPSRALSACVGYRDTGCGSCIACRLRFILNEHSDINT